MQQIATVWAGLDTRKQVSVVLAALAIVAAVVFMSRVATAPTMRLLYAGLESSAAADVIRELEARNVAYEVRGSSIFVPGSDRDSLRMSLAGEGLPATGGKGYELLDALSGFGTTSQMFDAAYWRAKEGELARTIVASPHIGQARVHIANPQSSPFLRGAEPTASVSVVPTGTTLTADQANALRYLVASAVAGLAVDDVAVIDANGTVVGTNDESTAGTTAEARAEVLRERVLRLVEARVGRGNAVVEVSVDTNTEAETIRQRSFDPEGRVAISTDTEESSDTSTNQNSDVTVASNLPDGQGANGGESKSSGTSTRERINYEVSETEREIRRVPGAVKRLTVAVLVNGIPGAAGAIAAFEPRPTEELESLRELVASAVGFDAERGDVITLKSMDLAAIEPAGTLAVPGFLDSIHIDVGAVLQLAVLGIVALLLGLFVVRPILASAAPMGDGPLGGDNDMGGGLGGLPELPGFDIAPAFQPMGDGLTSGFGTADPAMMLANAQGDDPVDEIPVDQLRELIGEKQEETVEILRSWLQESKEKA
ncbi:flagellar basal-body MS-ring/collar protein FliF [Chachezhania sediminis]|uniref:flagellar basal-body MS-ring/collar protein FliF n=1 Tax=Chachezhania sediminis TaxID=2599291 RepID=UPI00131D426F|nr:flagellar basal-body MS-ring/collar protein FliF [Chachezhania sediminis]